MISAVTVNKPEYKKGIFHIEPDSLIVKNDDEAPKEVRVWAIPDEPLKFKDDLIVMIKDNPLPHIIQMQCLG